MKKYPVKTSAIGILLFLEAMSCSALTLGRARGAVVLGQPLDITVPVQADEGDDLMSLCLEADVFYGDVQQVAGRITLTTTAATSRQAAVVRVRSSQAVNEPVVTANLRAGCTQKVARRFVFFADMPSDVAVPPQAIALVPAVSSSPVDSGVVPPTAAVGPAAPRRLVAAASPPVNAIALAVKARAPQAAPAPAAMAAGRQAAPKLKLVSIDSRQLNELELKFTQELFTQPAENAKSAAAAIALWRALNAQPEDILRDWQRLQTLDSDVKALRAATAKNESNLVEMRQLLQAAESGRFANGLVYGLVALLLASLAGIFLLWRRQNPENRVSNSWWQGAGVMQTRQDGLDEVISTRAGPSAPGELPTRTEFVDIDLDLSFDVPPLEPPKAIPTLTDSQVIPLERVSSFSPPTSWTVDRGFSPSMVNALRTTNSEEVVDARQQADFFVSLGQYDQAIQTLRERIDGLGEASPLVYLDLMQLLRRLGRRIDFNQCRDQFNRLFTGRVPEYASFDEKGKGLEVYGEVLAHITAEWSSGFILEILESCIFRRPNDDLGQPFDLLAFEDLLMLHAVATRLASDSPKG